MNKHRKKFYQLTAEERWNRLKENPNTQFFEGTGKTLIEITDWYFEQIQLYQFQLTVEEIATFLDCSYDFVLEKVVPFIPHIRITQSIRPELLKREGDGQWHSLLYKRILLQSSAWTDYLKEQATYSLKYERISIEEIEEIEEIQKWFLQNDLSKVDGLHQLNLAMLKLLRPFESSEQPNLIEKIKIDDSQLQRKWVSLKTVMKKKGFRHRIQAIRYLEQKGVNPIHFNGIARYDLREIEEEVLAYPFNLFHQFQSFYPNDWLDRWLNEAQH